MIIHNYPKKTFSKPFFWGIINIVLLFPFEMARAQVPSFGVSPTIDNPLKDKTIQSLVTTLIRTLLQIAVPIAVLAIIYSGFKFVTAQGNEAELKKAKEQLYWTIIGVAILMGAFVISAIIKGTIDKVIKGA